MIELAGVGHVYSDGSPWAHRALSGIDLSLLHASTYTSVLG